MSRDWPYSLLSSMAKEHGGPQSLIDDIWNDGFSEGETNGFVEGVVVTGIVGAVVVPIAKFAIDKYGDWKQECSQLLSR